MSGHTSEAATQPLGKHHDRAAVRCGGETLDRYLHEQARQDADKRVAAPLVAVRPSDKAHVLGYYTLTASVVVLQDLPTELANKLPRYPQMPVTLLGRRAVDLSARGQGLGELLLMDALYRSLMHATHIADRCQGCDVGWQRRRCGGLLPPLRLHAVADASATPLPVDEDCRSAARVRHARRANLSTAHAATW
jgi:hypothetical protein